MYGGALPSPSSSSGPPQFPPRSRYRNTTHQGQHTGSVGQGQYSPQLVLEQRLKLNQLQNQILQQQVSILLIFPAHSPCVKFLNGQGTTEGSSERQKHQNPYLGLPTPGACGFVSP